MHVSGSKLLGFTLYARLYKLLWPIVKPRKSPLKVTEHIAGHYGSKISFARSGGRKSSPIPKLGQKVGQKPKLIMI